MLTACSPLRTGRSRSPSPGRSRVRACSRAGSAAGSTPTAAATSRSTASKRSRPTGARSGSTASATLEMSRSTPPASVSMASARSGSAPGPCTERRRLTLATYWWMPMNPRRSTLWAPRPISLSAARSRLRDWAPAASTPTPIPAPRLFTTMARSASVMAAPSAFRRPPWAMSSSTARVRSRPVVTRPMA